MAPVPRTKPSGKRKAREKKCVSSESPVVIDKRPTKPSIIKIYYGDTSRFTLTHRSIVNSTKGKWSARESEVLADLHVYYSTIATKEEVNGRKWERITQEYNGIAYCMGWPMRSTGACINFMKRDASSIYSRAIRRWTEEEVGELLLRAKTPRPSTQCKRKWWEDLAEHMNQKFGICRSVASYRGKYHELSEEKKIPALSTRDLPVANTTADENEECELVKEKKHRAGMTFWSMEEEQCLQKILDKHKRTAKRESKQWMIRLVYRDFITRMRVSIPRYYRSYQSVRAKVGVMSRLGRGSTYEYESVAFASKEWNDEKEKSLMECMKVSSTERRGLRKFAALAHIGFSKVRSKWFEIRPEGFRSNDTTWIKYHYSKPLSVEDGGAYIPEGRIVDDLYPLNVSSITPAQVEEFIGTISREYNLPVTPVPSEGNISADEDNNDGGMLRNRNTVTFYDSSREDCVSRVGSQDGYSDDDDDQDESSCLPSISNIVSRSGDSQEVTINSQSTTFTTVSNQQGTPCAHGQTESTRLEAAMVLTAMNREEEGNLDRTPATDLSHPTFPPTSGDETFSVMSVTVDVSSKREASEDERFNAKIGVLNDDNLSQADTTGLTPSPDEEDNVSEADTIDLTQDLDEGDKVIDVEMECLNQPKSNINQCLEGVVVEGADIAGLVTDEQFTEITEENTDLSTTDRGEELFVIHGLSVSESRKVYQTPLYYRNIIQSRRQYPYGFWLGYGDEDFEPLEEELVPLRDRLDELIQPIPLKFLEDPDCSKNFDFTFDGSLTTRSRQLILQFDRSACGANQGTIKYQAYVARQKEVYFEIAFLLASVDPHFRGAFLQMLRTDFGSCIRHCHIVRVKPEEIPWCRHSLFQERGEVFLTDFHSLEDYVTSLTFGVMVQNFSGSQTNNFSKNRERPYPIFLQANLACRLCVYFCRGPGLPHQFQFYGRIGMLWIIPVDIDGPNDRMGNSYGAVYSPRYRIREFGIIYRDGEACYFISMRSNSHLPTLLSKKDHWLWETSYSLLQSTRRYLGIRSAYHSGAPLLNSLALRSASLKDRDCSMIRTFLLEGESIDELNDGMMNELEMESKVCRDRRWFWKVMNELSVLQQEAVKLMMMKEGILVLRGVFGCGKSYTLARAIALLYRFQPQDRILVVAETNAAIRSLLGKFISTSSCDNFEPLVRYEDIAIAGDHTGLADHLKPFNPRFWPVEDAESKSKWNIYCRQLEQLTKKRIVLATMSYARNFVLRKMRFPTVIVDEAGQVMELSIPQVIRSETRTLIIAGDSAQLDPYTGMGKHEYSYAPDGPEHFLGRSILDIMENRQGNTRVVNVEYRCHSAIGYTLQAFYPTIELKHGRRDQSPDYFESLFMTNHYVSLSDAAVVNKARTILVECSALRDKDYDMTTQCLIDESRRGSNPGELVSILCLLARMAVVLRYSQEVLRKRFSLPVSVLILSPYWNQVRPLARDIAAFSHHWSSLMNIETATIDSVQGDEREVLITSMVRHKCGLGFMRKNSKRQLVAFSRARDYSFTFAHADTFRSNDMMQEFFQRIDKLSNDPIPTGLVLSDRRRYDDYPSCTRELAELLSSEMEAQAKFTRRFYENKG